MKVKSLVAPLHFKHFQRNNFVYRKTDCFYYNNGENNQELKLLDQNLVNLKKDSKRTKQNMKFLKKTNLALVYE